MHFHDLLMVFCCGKRPLLHLCFYCRGQVHALCIPLTSTPNGKQLFTPLQQMLHNITSYILYWHVIKPWRMITVLPLCSNSTFLLSFLSHTVPLFSKFTPADEMSHRWLVQTWQRRNSFSRWHGRVSFQRLFAADPLAPPCVRTWYHTSCHPWAILGIKC